MVAATNSFHKKTEKKNGVFYFCAHQIEYGIEREIIYYFYIVIYTWRYANSLTLFRIYQKNCIQIVNYKKG